MRILIIGGTRLMGPFITQKLYSSGHHVILFHRGQTQTELPEGVQEVLGDRNHLSDYAEQLLVARPDVVLDMIAATERQAQELVAVFTGKVQRVVVPSSQDVYRAFGRVNNCEDGEVDLSLITEDSPLRHNFYPYRQHPRNEVDRDYDKILVEQVIMGQPELPGTVLRLPAVYGPRDYQHRMFVYLKRMLDGRSTILLESAVANWRWTHGYVENVADAIVLALLDPRASGRIYNVGEPFALSVTERIEQIARAVNWSGHITVVPSANLPVELRGEGNMAQDIVVDSSCIRHELGYSERVDLEEAFRRTIAWESANLPERFDPALFNYAAEDAVLAAM